MPAGSCSLPTTPRGNWYLPSWRGFSTATNCPSPKRTLQRDRVCLRCSHHFPRCHFRCHWTHCSVPLGAPSTASAPPGKQAWNCCTHQPDSRRVGANYLSHPLARITAFFFRARFLKVLFLNGARETDKCRCPSMPLHTWARATISHLQMGHTELVWAHLRMHGVQKQ